MDLCYFVIGVSVWCWGYSRTIIFTDVISVLLAYLLPLCFCDFQNFCCLNKDQKRLKFLKLPKLHIRCFLQVLYWQTIVQNASFAFLFPFFEKSCELWIIREFVEHFESCLIPEKATFYIRLRSSKSSVKISSYSRIMPVHVCWYSQSMNEVIGLVIQLPLNWLTIVSS